MIYNNLDLKPESKWGRGMTPLHLVCASLVLILCSTLLGGGGASLSTSFFSQYIETSHTERKKREVNREKIKTKPI